LSWDKENNSKAANRAEWLGLTSLCSFMVWDARQLDLAPLANGSFDYVINTENIEHIIDDRKLMIDIARLLKPCGWLLLTTPSIDYLPMSKGDIGPFELIEDGRHVRRGYSRQMLEELCEIAGLKVERFTFCSGRVSQLVTKLMRLLYHFRLNSLILQPLIVPLRILSFVAEILPWRGRCYSICMVAYKPRF
jgi:SAM-dependent methyltransferase